MKVYELSLSYEVEDWFCDTLIGSWDRLLFADISSATRLNELFSILRLFFRISVMGGYNIFDR